jgi:hypothetical protein
MDKYDYEQIDREISLRVNEIYNDPARHAFNPEGDTQGIRGGWRKGRKTFCDHCGRKRKDHAVITEQV